MDFLPIARTSVRNRGLSTASAEDVTLLGRVADADHAAFEALHCAYLPRLRGFLHRFTQQSELVEEILNDTMMIVWQKANTYNSTSKVSTWIFAIAYRQALKALSRGSAETRSCAAINATAAALEPEAELQQRQLREQLGQALRSLSMKHRTVIRLTYYQGYACREIADMIACPLNTVKTRMLHARRKLRALLPDQAA